MKKGIEIVSHLLNMPLRLFVQFPRLDALVSIFTLRQIFQLFQYENIASLEIRKHQ